VQLEMGRDLNSDTPQEEQLEGLRTPPPAKPTDDERLQELRTPPPAKPTDDERLEKLRARPASE
jgi:hypothetical protein